jgi:eukaryotic-like serine/threonine-protein kinase
MTRTEWDYLKDLFAAVLERPPDDQTRFLAGSCGGNDELKAQLQEMLARHALWNELFDNLPVRRAEIARLLAPNNRVFADGEVFEERWAIEQLLGRGGMGEVYKARDKQLERTVAIKVVQSGAPAQADLLARFQQERKILAALNHPHIARLFDAGATSAKQPYLVMEYVCGQPLDLYCDECKLDLSARIRLMLQVCGAVQYAHQNLVVHRDLKPSNILVTEDGEIKLLDFGIAKLLHSSFEESDLAATQTHWPALTPDYASPEQVRNLTITTATDVYALGVILHVLLTGQKPYCLSGMAPHEASRIICEVEPARPSTVAARARRHQFASDLDDILLCALRKDPSQRYSSIEQFSEDLQMYLEGMPIRARKQTLAYRAKKFIQRNKTPSAAAAIVLIVMTSGIGSVLWEAQIARNERDLAELRFRDIQDLSNWLLFDLHDAIAVLPGSTPVRAQIMQRTALYLDRLERDAEHDRTFRREIAAAYERIGYVQGHPEWGNIGDSAGALKSYEKALDLRKAVAAAQVNDSNAQQELASSHNNLGIIQETIGDLAGAIRSMGQAQILLERLAAAEPGNRRTEEMLADIHHDFGRALERSGDLPGARMHYRQGMERYEALARAFPADADIKRSLAITYKQNGVMLARAGDSGEAFTLLQKALTINEVVFKKGPTPQALEDLSFCQSDLGLVFLLNGDVTSSRKQYEEALALRLRMAAADPRNVRVRRFLALTYDSLGKVFVRSGDLPRAAEFYGRGISILASLSALDSNNVVVRRDLAEAYADLGTVVLDQAKRESLFPRRTARWRSAVNWYEHSQSEWHFLQSAGTLFGADIAMPGQLDRTLEASKSALRDLQKR